MLLSDDFTTEVLAGVRFAPLIPSVSRSAKLVIPSAIWNTSVHQFYPESFHRSCRELLLCSAAKTEKGNKTNLAATIPRALWIEILTYARRDWFEPPQPQEALLMLRVRQLESALDKSRLVRNDMALQLEQVEQERDLYRRMAMIWQSRAERLCNGRLSSDLLDQMMASAEHSTTDGENDDDSNESVDDDESMEERDSPPRDHAAIAQESDEDDSDDDEEPVNFAARRLQQLSARSPL